MSVSCLVDLRVDLSSSSAIQLEVSGAVAHTCAHVDIDKKRVCQHVILNSLSWKLRSECLDLHVVEAVGLSQL